MNARYPCMEEPQITNYHYVRHRVYNLLYMPIVIFFAQFQEKQMLLNTSFSLMVVL